MAGLPSVFERELLVFVGKGGVGKTTTAAAVGAALAREGRRTLVVTVDPAQRLKDAFALPIGHRVKQLRPGLHAMMLNPERLIEEWVRERVPDQDLTRHPLYKYISNYMPGLNELLAIGQLIELRREKDFQTIVVDTAPTGHALSFLTTPLKVRDLLQESLFLRWALRGYGLYRTFARSGRALKGLFRSDELPPVPEVDLEKVLAELGSEVGQIHELLRDRAKTAITLVTNPERLPVEESLELRSYLRRELGIEVAAVVLNRMPPHMDPRLPELLEQRREPLAGQLGPDLARQLSELAAFHGARRSEAEEQKRRLAQAFARTPLFEVPLQSYDVAGLDGLDRLWRAFTPWMGAAA